MFGFVVIDYIILAFTLIGAISACLRGFAREIGGKAGVFVGFLLAMMFTVRLSYAVREVFVIEEFWAAVIAFVVLFAAGYLFCVFVGAVTERALNGVNLSFLNKFLGLLLGILETFVIVCVILSLLSYQRVFDMSHITGDSFFFNKVFLPFKDWIMKSVPGVLI